AGIPVAVSGMISGVIVVAVNSWMQKPHGAVGTDLSGSGPFSPFLSPGWVPMAIHSTLSCYVAVGFAVAGVYAYGMLRGRTDEYHLSGLTIGMAVGGIAAVLQPLSGDLLGKVTAEHNPVKLAAMEAHFKTEKPASLIIGGIPDVKAREVRFAIRIP